MLNGEETDEWVFGSYNQHSAYFWVMNHHFYPNHTVLVYSLRRKPRFWMGLVAGQQTLLLVEPCQETALDKPENLTDEGGCVQYCSPSLARHTPSSGKMGLLVWRSQRVCLWSIRITFSFRDSENKIEDSMKSCKVRCQRWCPGRKLDPLPCSPFALKWCHTTKIILQALSKSWMNSQKLENWKKPD